MEPTLADIPYKIYYSISEVSQFAGVEPHVLRYWETKFTRLNPKRAGGNQRKYTRQDLELVLTIRDLLYKEKYKLDGAARKLRGGLGKFLRDQEKETRETAPQPTDAERQTFFPTAAPPANPVPAAPPPRRRGEMLTELKKDLREILQLVS